jgi:hypothetical protein
MRRPGGGVAAGSLWAGPPISQLSHQICFSSHDENVDTLRDLINDPIGIRTKRWWNDLFKPCAACLKSYDSTRKGASPLRTSPW